MTRTISVPSELKQALAEIAIERCWPLVRQGDHGLSGGRLFREPASYHRRSQRRYRRVTLINVLLRNARSSISPNSFVAGREYWFLQHLTGLPLI